MGDPIDVDVKHKTVFVLMPFERQFDLLFERILVPSFEKAGLQTLRADSVLDQQSVMRDVVEGIAGATLVVAEITHVNANVYYELGLAHALRKPTVLLTQDIAKVPFDLKGYRVLAYSTTFHEVEDLGKRLTEIADKHLAGQVRFGNPVTDYLDAPQATSDRSASNQSASAETGFDDELIVLDDSGFLDWINDLGEADATIGELFEQIAVSTEEVGERIAQRAVAMEESLATSNPSPKKARAFARDAANDLSLYADSLETLIPSFEQETERFVGAGINIAEWFQNPSNGDAESRETFRTSVGELLAAIGEGRPELEEYQTVVGGLRGITSELTKASTRAGVQLDQMLAVIGKIVAFCERSLAIVPAANVDDGG